MGLDLETVELEPLIQETLSQMEAQVGGRAVALRSEVEGDPGPILADYGKLKQVIINLVGNALKFTKEGEVLVRVETDERGGTPDRIRVLDTGVGISQDRLKAIFEAFQQEDGSTARRFGGTGLGLAISRSLCELMGYQLTVASEVGAGSTFTVHLRPGEHADREGEVGGLDKPPEARWAPAAEDPSLEFKGRTVLVVDDEADSRTLLEQYLEELGCRVLTAVDGVDGIDTARRERPDLVTVDLIMPRMSGWEMLRAMNQDPLLRDTPAVVVSVSWPKRTLRSCLFLSIFCENPSIATILPESSVGTYLAIPGGSLWWETTPTPALGFSATFVRPVSSYTRPKTWIRCWPFSIGRRWTSYSWTSSCPVRMCSRPYARFDRNLTIVRFLWWS